MNLNPIEFRSSLTAQLGKRPLPIMRQTAVQVIGLLSDPHSRIEMIAQTILHDEAFTARVLRVANSAYYRRHSEKITTVTQALLMTGYNTTRDIAITAEFAEIVQRRLPTAINLHRLLARAMVASHQASALGAMLRMPASEALFTSSLLESLGEFAIAAYLPEVSKKINDTITFTGLPYEDAHLQATKMTPHQVTELVVQALGLPNDLLLPLPSWETAASWDMAERRQAIVHLTNTCATNLFGVETPQVVSQFATIMNRLAGVTQTPREKVETVLAEAFNAALDFGSHVDLDRNCFALDGTTSPLSMRHAFIGSCIELVERTFGAGSAFA
jgi:HD-like signal output (HDOD) protein